MEANINIGVINSKMEASSADTPHIARQTTLAQKLASFSGYKLAALGLGIAVGVDVALHDWRALQKWRMLRRLRQCTIDMTRVLARKPLPADSMSQRLQLGRWPTLLLGPPGSGKSALLAQTAREAVSPEPPKDTASDHAKPCPAVYVGLRVTLPEVRLLVRRAHLAKFEPFNRENASAADRDDLKAGYQFGAMALRTYLQIGYPLRPSFISFFLRQILFNPCPWQRSASGSPSYSSGVLMGTFVRRRFENVLRLLFEVSKQLYDERIAAGIPAKDAPIVLLFDDVTELIATPRLAEIGGRAVYEELASLLLLNGTERGVVRAAVTGRPDVLLRDFAAEIGKFRVTQAEVQDPSPAVVTQALKDAGFSNADAERLIGQLGTRLRLLREPLESGAGKMSVDAYLALARDVATEDFNSVLAVKLGNWYELEMQKGLVGVFERMVEQEQRQQHEVAPSPSDGSPAKLLQDGGVAAPSLHNLPDALRDKDLSSVLHVGLGGRLTFQSQLHRNVWRDIRSQYVKAQVYTLRCSPGQFGSPIGSHAPVPGRCGTSRPPRCKWTKPAPGTQVDADVRRMRHVRQFDCDPVESPRRCKFDAGQLAMSTFRFDW